MANQMEYKPELVSSSEASRIRRQPGVLVIDTYEHGLDELFDIEHPWLKAPDSTYEATKKDFISNWEKGEQKKDVWIYYPWLKKLVRLPAEETFIRLRASRNRNLITEEERLIIQSKKVGIGGLSVGSSILNTLVLTSGPRHLKIADPDIISIPNLNRIMAPVHAVGMKKAVFFAQKSFEVDPFLTIDAYVDGMSPELFEEFFNKPRLDLFIEEMDDPYIKIESRKYAKKLRIPVIMAADNGDGVLIDVERFDLEPDRPLLHGNLKNIDLDNLPRQLPFAMKLGLIADMVRLEQADTRAQDSLEEVGTVLNTWPQLGTAAVMAGVALTFIARRILLGQPMPSGRYAISLEDHLVPNHLSSVSVANRQKHTETIMRNFRSFQSFVEDITTLK